MLDPVLAYYYIRFLDKMYWEDEHDNPTDNIFYEIIEELCEMFKGKKYNTFYISDVYSDGACKIIFYNETRFSKFVELKDVLEIK